MLTRVKHRTSMLSFQEGFSDEDVLAFDRALRERLGETGALQYTVEPKIRGAAVEIAYENGTLSLSATAGTGYEGDVVTDNVKTILTVPLTLWRIGDAPPFPEYLEVRGDVYLEHPAFERLNVERQGRGLRPFDDIKTAADDSLRQENPRVTAKTPLDMFCHGFGEMRGPLPRTGYEMMVILQSWGFRVNRRHLQLCSTVEELLAACRAVRSERGDWPFPTEGALVQLNRLDFRERLGTGWAMVYRL